MENQMKISPGLCELLADWHGGTKSACYYLLSEGVGTKDIIAKAIKELSKVEPEYSVKMRDDDKKELRGLIGSLRKLIKD